MQLFSSERSDEKRAKLADELRGMIRDAEGLLRDEGSGLLSRSREAAKNADDFVHEHAWTTVGVGALAGLVLGLLIAKR